MLASACLMMIPAPPGHALACKIPLRYKLGVVDERFNLDNSRIRMAMAEAEHLWEQAVGKNLFTPAQQADLIINFVFDQRQMRTRQRHLLRSELIRRKYHSDVVREEHGKLKTQYETMQQDYKKETDSYRQRLDQYQGQVAYWNDQGGAPKDIFTRLETQRQTLDSANRELEYQRRRLNRFIATMNQTNDRANQAITEYNHKVAEYNRRFGQEQGESLIKGTYQANRINIYQFRDESDLVLVIAHEFGHALSLDHVADTRSVMHYRISNEEAPEGITVHDLKEFARVCETDA